MCEAPFGQHGSNAGLYGPRAHKDALSQAKPAQLNQHPTCRSPHSPASSEHSSAQDIAHASTSVSFPLALGSKATALHAFNMRNELRAGLRTLQPKPHPVTPQGEMALAERARRGMVNDPRPGRLLSPALAPDAMLAPADLEVIAAHLHREPLLDRDQRVQVGVPSVVLVPLARLRIKRLPPWPNADGLVDALAQPGLCDFAADGSSYGCLPQP